MIKPLESPIKNAISNTAKEAVKQAAPESTEMDFDDYIINSAWEKFTFSVPPADPNSEEGIAFYKNGLGFVEQLIWHNTVDTEKRKIRENLNKEWKRKWEEETRLLEDARKAFHRIFPKGYTSFRKGCGNSHYFVARNVKTHGDEVSFRVSDHSVRYYSADHTFEFKRGNLESLKTGLNEMIESANLLKKNCIKIESCYIKLVK